MKQWFNFFTGIILGSVITVIALKNFDTPEAPKERGTHIDTLIVEEPQPAKVTKKTKPAAAAKETQPAKVTKETKPTTAAKETKPAKVAKKTKPAAAAKETKPAKVAKETKPAIEAKEAELAEVAKETKPTAEAKEAELAEVVMAIVESIIEPTISTETQPAEEKVEKSETTQRKTLRGMHLFDTPGEIIKADAFEVSEVIDDHYALAYKVKWISTLEGYYPENFRVLLTNDEGTYYYDNQMIKLPKGKCWKQIGIYKHYSTTVPIVKLMDK